MPSMKVARFYPPGGPENLKHQDEDIPSPGPSEVLIKVAAASIIWTELQWPIYHKDGSWIPHIPAHDFAGIIEAVGLECQNKDLVVGAEVYAFTTRRNHEGGLAEYALADEDQVCLKPKNISLMEAASVPLSALTAWQAIHLHGKLKESQRLLVTAGAGGTGVWAVQLAKLLGAHVIATASSDRSKTILQNLGVDEVVDYKETSLEKAVQEVDLILDCVGGDVFRKCLEVLKPGGVLVSINTWDAEQLAKAVDRRALFFIVQMDLEQMKRITQLIEGGQLRTVIDSTFPLEKSREAYEYGAAGHVHGKVVVTIP